MIEVLAEGFDWSEGPVWNLEQAVMIMGDSQLGEEITDQEAALITEFLKTLTGDKIN